MDKEEVYFSTHSYSIRVKINPLLPGGQATLWHALLNQVICEQVVARGYERWISELQNVKI